MLNTSDVKILLEEAYGFVSESYGIHPLKNGKAVYESTEAYGSFVDVLAQGLSPADEKSFRALAKNLRETVLHESNFTTNYSPYNQLLLPLLRIFFPRLVMREAVTIDPLSKPFDVKYFIKATAKSATGTVLGELPDLNGNLSSGPIIPISTSLTLDAGKVTGNLLTAAGLGTGSLQRDVMIVSATDGTDNTVALNVAPDNTTGTATINVTYPTSTNTANTDTLTIAINFANGDVTISSKTGNTTEVYFSGTVAMESNNNLNEIEFKLEPYQISAVTRKLNIKWSIEFEQDLKALFDLDAQSQLLSLLGAQIATDIDKELINDLIAATNMPGGITGSFDKKPMQGFAFGPKQWYENILVPINNVGGDIYQKTAIAPGNVIICNPLDAAILQSTGEYSKTGDLTGGELVGSLPYKVGELSNTYKVLITQLVPQGTMLVLLNPAEPTAAVYAYMPYIPVTIYPWPMGNVPSVTYMSRYAKRLFRPQGIGRVTITDTTP